MCSGADGIIGSFYNLFPDLYKQILKKVEESDIKGGMRLQRIADEVIFAALKYDFPSVLHNPDELARFGIRILQETVLQLPGFRAGGP